MKPGLDASMEYFSSGATESEEDPLEVLDGLSVFCVFVSMLHPPLGLRCFVPALFPLRVVFLKRFCRSHFILACSAGVGATLCKLCAGRGVGVTMASEKPRANWTYCFSRLVPSTSLIRAAVSLLPSFFTQRTPSFTETAEMACRLRPTLGSCVSPNPPSHDTLSYEHGFRLARDAVDLGALGW